MAQEFYINKGSLLPMLRMELIDDGRHDFAKFHEAIQNADITFTMKDMNTGEVRIMNAPAMIRLRENDGCAEQYVICYEWKERDVRKEGTFKGYFKVDFKDNLSSHGVIYPVGTLIVPIREDLIVYIK